MASTSTEEVSLVPSGRELDYKLAYSSPLGKRGQFDLELKYSKDYQHVAGQNRTAIGARWQLDY